MIAVFAASPNAPLPYGQGHNNTKSEVITIMAWDNRFVVDVSLTEQ